MTNPAASLPPQASEPMVHLLLAAADDKLLLGHRNGDWTGLGPILEEDIAFSNIAQDEIAHAQELYKLAAALIEPQSPAVTVANRLAYARPTSERLCAELVVIADEFDWAAAVARQFFFDHYDAVRLPRFCQSSYRPLANLAGKMLLEIDLHLRHFDGWIHKLGRGTAESRRRIQAAIDRLWPHALGLFEPVEDQGVLGAAGLYPGDDADAQQQWQARVHAVLDGADLPTPGSNVKAAAGGRRGRHSPALAALLDELGEVYRLEPNAAW